MTKNEIKKRYKQWVSNPNKTSLNYLEEWEQWICITYDDPELYIELKKEKEKSKIIIIH